VPFNGSGVFQRVRNWVADATAGIKIRADYHDTEDDGFAAGLSNTITKDGQTTITQNIPFNSKRITGLADPINPQDASTKAYTDTKLPAAGGTPMTGNLTITNTSPVLTLNNTDPAGGSSIQGQKNGLMRWLMRLGNGTAESGANAGSDFDLIRYDDAGVGIDVVLGITRSTGLGTVRADPTAPLGIVTKQYADAGDATAAASANSRVLRAGDAMTGLLYTAGAVQPIGGAGGMGTIEIRGDQPGISFHSPGAFAANFGMTSAGDFFMGGWSYGAVAYKFWTTKDFAALPTLPANTITGVRLLTAGDQPHTAAGVTEPYPGAVVTGNSPTVSGVYFFSRYRWLQVFANGGWTTVGTA